jgi:LPXTG-site transpeptidase (sortase) family protein
MDGKKRRNRVIIIFCFVICVIGFIVLSYNYFVWKKNLAFETINLEANGNKPPKYVKKKETPILSKKSNPTVEADYIGYLKIEKIGLYKGFVDKNSSLNNVDYNMQIINPSDYPDVDKGNFIIAAHSGNSSIAYFKNLYKLSVGDQVDIYYNSVDYVYTIDDIYTQPKNGSVSIYRDVNVSTLTLITCTKNNNKTQTIYIASLTNKK